MRFRATAVVIILAACVCSTADRFHQKNIGTKLLRQRAFQRPTLGRLFGPRTFTRKESVGEWVARAARRRAKPKPVPILDDDLEEPQKETDEPAAAEPSAAEPPTAEPVAAEPATSESAAVEPVLEGQGGKKVRPGRSMADLKKFQEERRLERKREEEKRKKIASLEKGERDEVFAGDLRPTVEEVRPGVTVINPPRVVTSDAPLPEGWQKYQDANGKTAYYNVKTRESSLFPPDLPVEAEVNLNATDHEEIPQEERGPYKEIALSDDPHDYITWRDVARAEEDIERERASTEKKIGDVERQLEKIAPQNEYYSKLVAKLEQKTAMLTEMINKIEPETPEERTERELYLEELRENKDPISMVLDSKIKSLHDIPPDLIRELGDYGKEARKFMKRKGSRRRSLLLPDSNDDDDDD